MNKMEKGEGFIGYLLLVVCFMFLLLLNVSSAQTIGGEVFQDGRVSPVGQTVFIYGVEDLNKYAEVDVSFDGNKYQFSPKDFWGYFFRAEVLDFVNGYMAGPVEMNLSEDNSHEFPSDYDIFPSMKLREVVRLKDSSKKLFISQNESFGLDLDVYEKCDLYRQEGDELDNLCENCTETFFNFSGDFGKNNLNFIVDCDTGKREKTASRDIKYENEDITLDFYKTIKALGNETYFVSYFGDKSGHQFDIIDFIPKEFEVYGVLDKGNVKDYRRGYYEILWENVYGHDFNFGYFIEPKEWLENCKYGISSGDINLRDLDEGDEIDIKNENFFFDCNFSKDIDFFLLESVNFSRDIDDRMRVDEEQEVFVVGNLSHNVSLELREYVPVSFDVVSVSNGGRVERSSNDYNVIVWDVSGSGFDFSYNVVPSVSGDFSFGSFLGGEKLGEDNVTAYTFVPPVRKSRGGGGGYVYHPKNFSKVGKDLPIVSRYENLTAALYSKNYTESGAFEILDSDFLYKVYNSSLDLVSSYSLENNLGENVGNFSFEFDIEKDFLKKNKYRDLEAYGFDSKGKRFRLNGYVVSGEDGTKFVSYGNDYFGRVAIYGVKDRLNLWDKILQWFWNLGIRI